MARAIDADALQTSIGLYMAENAYLNDTPLDILKMLSGWIDEQPTIEAEPVRHGKWKIKNDDFDCEYMKCSCCKEEFYNGNNDTIDTLHNYCPNCGADMRGE